MAALAAPERSRPGPTTATSSTLAVFDLDRTLIPGSSLVHLGRALARRGLVSPWMLPGHLARNLVFQRCGASESKVERFRDSMLGAFSGTPQALLESAVMEVAVDVAAHIYSGARWLLEEHLERGDFCVVLSASPHELVTAVSGLLGADRGVGTVAEVVDGCYTGRLSGPFCQGRGKLDRLAQEVGPVRIAEAAAYSDSASDLVLLRSCRRPVAVNPDRALRAVARSSGWPILRFN
jgi:HAD superfamily hydrolase (TIGR01490 family)